MDRKLKAINDSKAHHEKLITQFNQNVAEMNTSIQNKISDQGADFERKLDTIQTEVNLLPHKVDQAMKSFEIMHANIREDQNKIQKEIMDLCKVDEFRIQSCEGKLRALPEFQKKLNALNSAIMQMKGLEGDIREVKLFTERQLPGLIHLQLCEGLNSIAGN